ncbi:MAG: LamG-like jellyroll fold domain-containing protein, partial [Anaerolineae bacterium]
QATPPAHAPGDYLQVGAGDWHTCGLKAGGTVACWGDDHYGQVTPPAHGPGDYLQVSAGDFHSCGLKASGTVACWGSNLNGQAPQLSLAPATLPCAPAGEGYHQPLPAANGGTPPYTYTAVTTLPPGLALDAGGVVTGTPTAAGFYTWTIQAGDSFSLPFSVEQVYSVTVGGLLVHADPAGTCGGGVPCFAALQDAATCVQFGGTVDAHGATYAEVLTVTRSLTLTGAPILDGPLTLGDGLAAYWPFDAGSGAIAQDASGYSHDGALSGGAAWTATAAPLAFGSPHALAFDGQDDYVLIPDHPDLNFDAEPAFTLAAWVQTDRLSQQPDGAAILAKGQAAEEQYALDIYLGALHFLVRDDAGGSAYDLRAADVLTAADGWTHVAAVLDAEQDLMALYVDGVEQAHRPPPLALRATGLPLSIGNRMALSGAYDLGFEGRIDDARIYGRALSAPEIAALAAGGHNNRLVLGADLDLDGDLTLNATMLDSGAGDQALDLSGDWTSYGGAFAAQAGTVRFDGTGVQILAGDVAFHDLTVGAGVSLTTASQVSVGGTLTNLGWTVESQAIDGPGAATFGLAGLTVDVTAQGSLSGLVVARRDEDHPQAHPATATGRYWRITPSGSGYTATLTLPHAGLADPYASKYLGPGWDWGREAFTAASVTRSGITAFSDWAVSEGPPT